jgi:MEMO1 family protein
VTGSPARPFQFAGTWYPETLEEAESYWEPVRDAFDAKAVIVPHSAWMYSGRVAGAVYGRIRPADTFIVVGPNHTGHGSSSTSLYARGRWFLPEKKIEIDESVADALLKTSEYLTVDYESHAREHAVEVQLPFFLLLNPAAKLVPIVMRDSDPDQFRDLGRSIAAVAKKFADRRIVLVASSDFSHHENRKEAARQDQRAIEQILALNADGLKDTVDRFGISICGAGPIAATLIAARTLGATQAEQVAYATSGDKTQDDEAVTSYAGIVIH